MGATFARGEFRAFLLGCLACLISGQARADVVPNALFSDGAVLQQGWSVPVWGQADPGEEVVVKFDKQTKKAVANADGAWMAMLDPMEAGDRPRTLLIRGRNEVAVRDVLVGEVWLCAGQSNMAMAFGEAEGAAQEAQKSDPLFRSFRVPERPAERPWNTLGGEWSDFSAKTAGHWSAMPYFFGKRLREELGVPVGVIVCAWGGSSAVAWMSPRALRGLGGLVPEEVTGWRSNVQPSRLFNGMLHPIVPYSVAGVVWYQGETEGEPFMNAYAYRTYFPALIKDWRRLWRRESLPFYWVQLPNLQVKSNWEIVRESQAAALSLPGTGMISTIDIGRSRELHPPNKQEFGGRLADLVLGKSYHRDTWPGAPKVTGIRREADGLRLSLADAGGLVTKDGLPPKGFWIAGEDQQFFPADGKIEGDSVFVSARPVPAPVAVRYAWEANPSVNLVNAAGLPLAPYRSDSWMVPGQQWQWMPLEPRKDLARTTDGERLASGEDSPWTMSVVGVDIKDLEKYRMIRKGKAFCQIIVSGDRRGDMTLDSPAIFWKVSEAGGQIGSLENGITVEAMLQMFRATDPFRGFDIEVGLRKSARQLIRYRISIVPMRLFAFQKNEIRLLASNLDNGTACHAYRMAIRPDGVAQVYFDGQPTGIFEGEAVEGEPSEKSYIRIGKQVETGEFTANLNSAGFDTGGAFSPQAPLAK